MSTLALPGFELGAVRETDGPWQRVAKFDPRAVALADRHCSRRKIGSPQFMPPGQTVVLLSLDERAVFGWWRPHPDSGLRAIGRSADGRKTLLQKSVEERAR